MERQVKEGELGWAMAQGCSLVDQTKDGEHIVDDTRGEPFPWMLNQEPGDDYPDHNSEVEPDG